MLHSFYFIYSPILARCSRLRSDLSAVIRRLRHGHTVNIKALKALLNEWDVISALHACGRRKLGCEGVAIVATGDTKYTLTKVPRKFWSEASLPQKKTSPPRDAKHEINARFSNNFWIWTFKFGKQNVELKILSNFCTKTFDIEFLLLE